MIRHYALDLKDDPELIAEYEAWHRRVWPEVLEHLQRSGITRCTIRRAGNRLFMSVESSTGAPTDGGGGALPDRVREWEDQMDGYQQRLPFAKPGEKWTELHALFDWSAEP
jgi:L-rhamnose mutarotase